MKSMLHQFKGIHKLSKKILFFGLIFAVGCWTVGLGAYFWASFLSPAGQYLEAVYISKSCMEAAPACIAAAVTAAVISDLALRDKK